MEHAYINSIATTVPDFDVHKKFIEYCPRLLPDERSLKIFQRMAERSQIEHRYSFLEPHADKNILFSPYTSKPPARLKKFFRLPFFPTVAPPALCRRNPRVWK